MKMKYTFGAMILAATAATGMSATPAQARVVLDNSSSIYDQQVSYDRYDDYDDYYEERRYRKRYYRDRRRYDRRRYHRGRRCDRGRGGTVIGAVAGGLLGNEVARRGNKTEGAIIGAAVGALAGRAIDKADNPCRRRYRYRR